MISDLTFEFSPWWLLPVLLGAAGATWVLYGKSGFFSGNRRWTLAILRFLTLFIIGLLLISPLLKTSERVNDKPILIWLEDHSSSMVSNPDSAEFRQFVTEDLADLSRALEDKYDLKKLSFGENIEEYQPDSFPQLYTDISSALQSSGERFYNQNIGAALLITDGIYNRGANPVYASRNLPFPIFSLGTGDTTVEKDIFIESLSHNEITYLNNQFPVEIGVRARKLEGKSYRLTILDQEGRSVYTHSGVVQTGNQFTKVEAFIKAEKPGIRRYTVSIALIEGETNTENNARSFNIEIIDNRKEVLIWGSSPHPDMGAIASALTSLEKYELNTFLGDDFRKEKLPDLFVLHQPNRKMLQRVKESGKPSWIILGAGSDIPAVESMAGIKAGSGRGMEDAYLTIETNFSSFNLDQGLINLSREWPPLQAPFGKITGMSGANTLFYKKIGSVETTEPLWFFNDENGLRNSYLLASGIWQWRIYDYRTHSSFDHFDELIAKTVQYLTARNEDRRFIVESQTKYNTRQQIRMSARLYNPSLELDNTPEVEIDIRSEGNEEYTFDFSKTSVAYELNAGNLPPGNYKWTASAKLGEEEFIKNGTFSVEEIKVEQSDLVARHDILKSISEGSGGEFYTASELELLKNTLLENDSAKSIQRLKTNISSLLNEKWIFFLLLIFLALEWGLRKYFGKY